MAKKSKNQKFLSEIELVLNDLLDAEASDSPPGEIVIQSILSLDGAIKNFKGPEK